MKTIFYSKNVFYQNKFHKGNLIVENDKIIDFIYGDILDNAISYENDYIIPGLVDTHVHVNEPGRTDWEGFETATKSALAGGITTLVDMPLNCIPVTTSRYALELKMREIKNKLHTDCGFWGGIIPNNESNLEELLNSGVLGCKAFLIHSGIDDFPKVNEEDLRKSIPIMKKYDLPILIHAELESFEGQTENYNNPRSYSAFLNSRPKEIEDNAIKLMIKLCKEFDAHIHIVHLSSANSIDLIKKAKEEGLRFSVETCPHYLAINAEEIQDGQTIYKCCPPIREKNNNDLLWEAIKNGIIDIIVSDHSPCTANLKLIEKGDIEHAWGGISSLQFSFSIVWTEFKKRNLPLELLIKLMCKNTSKLIKKENIKGSIDKNYFADFIVWNPNEKFKVTKDIIFHKNKETPYLGRELFGKVKKVYLRGKLVFDENKFSNPLGNFILNEVI
ncbi:MAG: allantoinase [Candidatus Sericytochromatia bacterium]|nr:MAG: allantoinase [Candidatus Sericytochromatia bacterium]